MPILRTMRVNEPSALRRRVFFQVVGTDGKTPVTTKNGEQPQITIDGAAFTDGGIGTLNHIGHGRYYAELEQATLNAWPLLIETRFASAGTLEIPGDSVEVVAFKPGDECLIGTIRAAGTAALLNVADAGLLASGKYVGASLCFLDGNKRGECDKISVYVGTVGAKQITLTKGLSSNAYAVGDRFMIIGA
jgi:hypothetical protein